ncbi:uncharacterized protein FIBRA_05805 [Fibroporia radiculosa]|uniref:25S rRNA (uridine-N(3))-methyltransferase BMT5-like domain-containing protein n=1 Tax=Fibroporia radiculosa TaxID=599839 RepID=J4IAX3_9APHY|nr:uncharacterized protein FIBRA_05805 [Fibroporia radiculosa]CCM03661.1 predicted protein [Fibroporia radiculosa]
MGKGGKKTSLKTALSTQQSRLKQKAVLAARAAEKSKKAKSRNKAVPPHYTIPFKPTDQILLIGEGNFSFVHALALNPPPSLEFLPAPNITATAYDSEQECYAKYPDAAKIVHSLREKDVEVIFSVDATKLESHPGLKGRRWDKIVWNFPHAGRGITDQDRNILSNQTLILEFLRSAANLLVTGPVPAIHYSRKGKQKADAENDELDGNDPGEDMLADELIDESTKVRGSILITLRNVAPYTLWDLPNLAKKPPPPKSTQDKLYPRYMQLRSFAFQRSVWKGYGHRMTKGERAHGQGKTGEGGEDRTWEFCLQGLMSET